MLNLKGGLGFFGLVAVFSWGFPFLKALNHQYSLDSFM